MQLADALVSGDESTKIEDLVDRDGVLAGPHASIQRTRDRMMLPADWNQLMNVLFRRGPLSKKKHHEDSEDEEEIVKEIKEVKENEDSEPDEDASESGDDDHGSEQQGDDDEDD
jgi:hypothetical protein